MVEGREERLAEDCAVRDVPRLVAPVAPAPGPAPAPTTATIDYTYTTTNLAGDTTAAGTNAPVARLVMTDRPGGGVDFTLTNLAGENFGSNDYLSRLFLSVDPSVDTSTWGFSNAASSEASIGGVTFGSNTEVVDGYLYPIRVNFQRPGGAGGTADPLLEGDSARFLFPKAAWRIWYRHRYRAPAAGRPTCTPRSGSAGRTLPASGASPASTSPAREPYRG